MAHGIELFKCRSSVDVAKDGYNPLYDFARRVGVVTYFRVVDAVSGEPLAPQPAVRERIVNFDLPTWLTDEECMKESGYDTSDPKTDVQTFLVSKLFKRAVPKQAFVHFQQYFLTREGPILESGFEHSWTIDKDRDKGTVVYRAYPANVAADGLDIEKGRGTVHLKQTFKRDWLSHFSAKDVLLDPP